MSDLTLRRLRGTNFHEIYSKLLINLELSDLELTKLLQIAVVLINCADKDIKNLGHRIVLLYSIKTQDLVPLYDLSVNLGHIPVAKLIERSFEAPQFSNSFFKEFLSSSHEIYKYKNKYLTEEQKKLTVDFNNNTTELSRAIIAPTSYGKTDLILSTLNSANNIIILVPTKALLAQTKARVLNADEYSASRKIITHHEMYNSKIKNKFVAILTQERAVKILQKNPNLSFDIAFIDEAHNLLEDSQRSRLLAVAIMMIKKRNDKTSINYLTPFLFNHEYLKVLYTPIEIIELRINESVKSELVYLSDMRRGGTDLEVYDPYLNQFIDVPNVNYSDEIDLINSKSTNKNIIYINKPVDIEDFVKRLIPTISIINSAEIQIACSSIADYLHEEYSLVDCLKSGLVFHHGSVPDSIKLYLEYLFSNNPDLKFIVTTSTLLEGVNIPAQTLFLLSDKKGNRQLSSSQFKNLIGRVCRFSEVFDAVSGQIRMLNPKIYMIGSRYAGDKSNLKNFLQKTLKVDKKPSENPENILLNDVNLNEKQKIEKKEIDSYIENISPGLTKSADDVKSRSQFGKLCYENNIFEFNIQKKELEGQAIVDNLLIRNFKILNAEDALETINSVFIELVEENNKNKNILRLRDLGARNFYKMIIDWKLNNTSYKQMIFIMLKYWNERESTGEYFVYVGKWGDRKGEEESFSTSWIDLREKSHRERVNLAIVRIKEEQDFFENNILKFIDVFQDLNLIENTFYLNLKFGTNDIRKINMIKNGFSLTLSNLLLDKYSNFVNLDTVLETVQLKADIIEKMELDNQNQVIIHEARLNVGK